MKITNTLNLPSSFVQMAQRDYIVKDNEYRVTSLLKGVRETILERRHHSEIERDCSDMIWLLFGTAVHSVLEKQQETDSELKEERLKVSIGKYILSGQFDLYCAEEKKITDYKTASVWKVIFGDFTDWRRQLLIYAWMLTQTGFDVKSGEVVALLKDHSKSRAKYDKDYPQQPVVRIPFVFTGNEFVEIKDWLIERFNEIYRAEQLPDDELPLCTTEERWNTGNKFAVMKKGRKSALRVLDSRGAADAWMAVNGKGDYVEMRESEDKKCQDYCPANAFCSYWQEKQRGVRG